MVSSFKVTFIGTGGSWPVPGRAMPCIVLQSDDVTNLLDCGEGSQKRIMESRISFMQIDNIFLTHFHGDHFLGIMGLIQSMSFNGREKPLHIYGPIMAKNILQNALSVGYYTLSFDIFVHELLPDQTIQFNGFRVRTLKNDHPVPALSYSFEENDLVKIDRKKVDSLNIPDRRIEEIRGSGYAEINGRVVTLGMIAAGLKKGRRVVYSGDTRPMESMKSFAYGADVLIHETTTDSQYEPKVNEFGHTSSRQAAQIASDAKVKRFYLFHYSPRIPDPRDLLVEARSIFKESYLSKEFLEYEVPKRTDLIPMEGATSQE
ncbi:MAG: ribonuclease Z [Thermoplasmataceae archaeon]|jgi:ribonuclease Z